MTDKIKLLRNAQPEVLLDASSWEKISSGPHTVNLNAYASEGWTKTMGTWICTPGKWAVDYKKCEYCDFREGYRVLTP